MSLINRMLQDLDARSGNAAVIVPQPAVRPVAVTEKNQSWMIGVAVLCVVAAGAGGWYWFAGSKGGQTPPASPPIAAKPAPVASATQDKVATVPQTPSSAPQAAVVIPVAATAPTPVAVQITAKPAENPARETPVKPTHAETNPPKVAAVAAAMSKKPVEPEPEVAPKPMHEPKIAAAASRDSTLMPAKQVRELTPYQRAENEYRRASGLAVQGKTIEAAAALEQALQLDVRHAAARQMLSGMMVEAGRADDAIALLKTGLALDQTQPGLAMSLARLQVEKGDMKAALETLHNGLPYAADFADYHAFLAALLQRQDRHKEAVDEYGAALRLVPQNGLWWMGIGISLQADNRAKEARDAYVRAKAANTLSPDLQSFVDQKLAQLPN